jgi:hypothetical protein
MAISRALVGTYIKVIIEYALRDLAINAQTGRIIIMTSRAPQSAIGDA